MELQENLVVADRFRLVRMIGRGGMGSVWQAVNISIDQPCAVKFIEGELGNVTEAHARFEREAKAAAQLRSPHVVQIFDHGVWAGRPYIAMELLEGEDLGRALARAGGQLPPAHVNAVIQQVCRALTRAHGAGIVHRDLKPENIFLVADDDRQLVKILDFGVAKQTSQKIEGSNTKTGAMLGTPYYMSPEQAQGIKTVDARSDLWSLAVIVFQCLTGRLPFESEALGDLLVKIIVQPVPIPSTLAPVPPGFDAWWAKAAERNPDQRFATAKDFAVALALAVGASVPDEAGARNLRSTAVLPAPGTLQSPGNTPPFSNPEARTPPGLGMPPAAGSYGNGMTPATFSGVEPPFAIPKKGPPALLFVGLAALGVAGAVAVVLSLRAPKPPVVTPATTVTTSAEPVPASSASATASVLATASPVPSPSENPATSATTAGIASVPPRVQARHDPPPRPSAQASSAPSAAPSSTAKKWVPGF